MIWAIVLLAVGATALPPAFRVPVGSTFGPSGVVPPFGSPIQFTAEEAGDIAVIGPSGVVFHSGRNVQFYVPTEADKSRVKRSALRVPVGTTFGPSGYVPPFGAPVQFTAEEAGDIAVAGPSGVVFKSGRNIQFYVPTEAEKSRVKRSPVFPDGWLVGASGAIGPNGELVQFREGGAKLLLDGSSGAVFSDGTLVQKRPKRAAPTGNLIGHSGIITRNGKTIQLPAGVHVVLDSRSGIVLSNGMNIQLDA